MTLFADEGLNDTGFCERGLVLVANPLVIYVQERFSMLARCVILFVLLVASRLAASTPDFLLGMVYSHDIGPAAEAPLGQVAVDAQRFVYSVTSSNAVAKRTPTGAPVWVTSLGSSFRIGAITVDLSGNVYAVSSSNNSPYGPALVAKINGDGTVSGQSVVLGTGLQASGLAVDGNGHLWVTGNTVPQVENPLQTTANAYQKTLPNTTSSHAFVARLNTTGTAIDYATYLSGSIYENVSGIAADGSGSALIAGYTSSKDFPLTAPGDLGSGPALFLARLEPDGSGLVYSLIVKPGNGTTASVTLAVDAGGDAAIDYLSSDGGYSEGALNRCTLSRFDPQGALIFSKTEGCPSVIMEAAGNTYVTGTSAGNHSVRNSVAPCGGVYLDVYSSAGDLLQSTWLQAAGAILTQPLAMTMDPNSTVLVLTNAELPASDNQVYIGVVWLTALSPNPFAQALALACVADAALYAVPGGATPPLGTAAGIAPGEIVSLFGQGLGPQQGVQPPVTLESGYPVQVAGVQVLFDGQAAPLLYVQDGQINAIVPWGLTPGSTATVCVSYNSMLTNCLNEPVIQAAPAVFTIDGAHAAALNQDGTINSSAHPAPAGTIVSVFATGLGPIKPAANDGDIVVPPLPENVLGVTADILLSGGLGILSIPVPVVYAGPAPYEVAGLSQINLQIPATSLKLARLFLRVGNASAPLTLYLASTN